jgi:hypothetical protein
MQPWQLTNHFLKNTAITTKVGLQHSLRNLSWFASENEDSIFPRGYDLNLASDLAAFLDDYRIVRAESLLKVVLLRAKQLGFEVDLDIGDIKAEADSDDEGNEDAKANLAKAGNGEKLEVNERMLKVLLNVCQKKAFTLEDEYIDDEQQVRASAPILTRVCTQTHTLSLSVSSRSLTTRPCRTSSRRSSSRATSGCGRR